MKNKLVVVGWFVAIACLTALPIFAQAPLEQTDLLQNKLRPQPPHRVIEIPAPRKPSVAPESQAPHRVLAPTQDLESGPETLLPEMPEYEAPMIFEEDSMPLATMQTPNASGPAVTTQPPSHTFPFEPTAEQIHSHILHGDKSGRRPPIPAAVRQPVWKTPYSYGHFGAGRTRQWTLHYGFTQNYTQWTLR